MRGAAAAFVLLLLTPSSALALDGTYDPPKVQLEPELVATGRATSLAIAPDGTVVFGDISGPVKRVNPDTGKIRTIYTAPAIVGPEWGLTGVALAPDFEDSGDVYVAYTTGPPGTNASRADVRGEMRIVRVDVDAGEDPEEQLVYSYVATRGHNGGKLLIRDGLLYVSNGDHKTYEAGAQDPSREEGKILRMTLDGKPAPGNPHETSPEWHPYAYSMGHRNPFGLDWDEKRGHLVASEAGNHSDEEINIVLPGHNYGWPLCEGRCKPARAGLTDAIVVYPKTITPVGMAVAGDEYFVASFNFGELRRVYQTPEGWTDEVVYDHSTGIMDVKAHEEWIYFATWNGVYRVKVPPRENPYVPPTPEPTPQATPTPRLTPTPPATPTLATPTTPTGDAGTPPVDDETTVGGAVDETQPPTSDSFLSDVPAPAPVLATLALALGAWLRRRRA